MFYKDLDFRKELVRNFIRNNPKATHKEIKKKLHTKVDKVYKGKMAEAFKDAGIQPPRTFERKTKDEKRLILIDYVRKNQKAGGHIIRKDTKINFFTLFKTTEEMFEAAGIYYPRKEFRDLRNKEIELKKKQIIEVVRNDPLLSIDKIGRQLKTHPYSLFKNAEEIYNLAEIPFIEGGAKRRINKQNQVIDYIKQNTLATQREINMACKTHVQLIFKNGIFEAYQKAEVSFPFERLKVHGSAIKSIGEESRIFEKEIAEKLSGYGKVDRLVKTKRGFADVILERNKRKAVIEIKNYKAHEISISQVKQLNRYLEDINTDLGFLICLKKPKKDNFLMECNKIFIILESELTKIPYIMDL
ncbi:DUF91 domain-containing protein [Candidatus Pacearchaeota archaeon]|nr:DUF91 domain-containing protein [Candidatus Pacearchaeota archaeon]